MKSKGSYVHGYTPAEQDRLVSQAKYWRDDLILRDLRCQPGEKLLEIGCAAGATLGVIGKAFPGLRLSGIDIEPAQIAYAERYLIEIGITDLDLQVGDAHQLPWPDNHFDHVYIIWLLEHLQDATPILREALRVLKPAGKIVLSETDYDSFWSSPQSPEFEYLRRAQFDLFEKAGNPIIGRQLGALLRASGFSSVYSTPCGFHYFEGSGLRAKVEYLIELIGPYLGRMADELGRDLNQLRDGLKFLEGLPEREYASFTQIIFRACAEKPNE